jgi:hypothetical protein
VVEGEIEKQHARAMVLWEEEKKKTQKQRRRRRSRGGGEKEKQGGPYQCGSAVKQALGGNAVT